MLAVVLPGDPSEPSIVSRHDSPGILVAGRTFVENVVLIVVILDYFFHTVAIENTCTSFVVLGRLLGNYRSLIERF